eukprot:CAMPEP_0198498050 /NCGR_PEP_ID=MMETSP1462-20131121/6768_1 /TAXON_ID=1333877 /ORGANISM="Brandtodinium nutriculum, Strain RCC3387" /LENGTH=264 /DNA_ID=CAMNT_0044226947 /DNA_START=103 /DNA_END=897 /DNA_ORIENTATION=+
MAYVGELVSGGLQLLPGQQKVDHADFGSDLSTDFGSDHSDCEGVVGEDDGVEAPTFAADDTLLILDWDDTLLPTSWIEAQGLGVANWSAAVSGAQRAQLDLMAERAALTLRVAKSFGRVIIVTNAEHGWIEMSCKKFMPSLWQALEDVKALSARSVYERQGVMQPGVWKLLAFRGEIDRVFGVGAKGGFGGGPQRNIVSVGDSLHEREALIRVTECCPNSWAKVLKLMEKPTAEEFLKEHEVLCSVLGDIVNHEGNLDVSLCSP